ncbi:MAG: S26 family signal peptidase [Candidatus Thermoplasmatota archaeon]|nr:S26 family signal peptidase [Candidatus Thermoplasmatota archaeon]MCL5731505.1 S26 family signal peptidase [Candidatus Thermoplasmatota archaeon]
MRVVIAVAIIFLAILAGLTVYSGVLPPFTIVSSGSMQHSDTWEPGIITTGDIVYLKKPESASSIVTYLNGTRSGYRSFGEYGQVIVYRYDGHQIIHRAMFYLSWNGSRPVVYGYNSSLVTIGSNFIILRDVGYSGNNLIVNLAPIRNMSGFITCGDFNLGNSYPYLYNKTLNGYYAADQDQILGFFDPPVKFSEIVGYAVFDIPWFGLIKLWPSWELGILKEENPAPLMSYVLLILSLALATAIISAAYIVHRHRHYEN